MKDLGGDILATVHFYETSEGGRETPTPPDRFGCLMSVEGKYFDVRLLLRNVGSVSPGQTVKVPIAFLDKSYALQFIHRSTKFLLKEVRNIGEGVVNEIV